MADDDVIAWRFGQNGPVPLTVADCKKPPLSATAMASANAMFKWAKRQRGKLTEDEKPANQ